MKRIITLLGAILCTTSIAMAAIQTGVCGDNVTWSLDTDSGVLTISGTGDMSTLIRREGMSTVHSNFPAWKDYCEIIKTVIISEGVTSIRENAFFNCSNLISVSIPDGITSISNSAFENCNNLQYVEFASVERIFEIDYGNVSANPIYYAHHILVNGEEITELTIPNTVTSIGKYAFKGLSNLTVVHIPNSVTSIGEEAFSGCSSLTSVTIPNSVTSIGMDAFSGCSSLTSVTIPNSVTSIGKYAFYGCSSLTSITVPESVTSIGFSAFGRCGSLESITLPFVGDKPQTETDTDQRPFGYIFGYTDYTSDYYIPKSLKTVVITGSNYIPNGAFSGCSGLTSVTIPNSVTSIGTDAFSGCSGLTSVTIPNSVTSIGNSAFDRCTGLTAVIIPNSVTSTGEYAFCGCSGLTSITIPNSVTSIGNSVFNGCTGLTSVTIPNSVTSIGNSAFNGCTGLTSVTIPNSVTSIGEYAFNGCTGLTTVTIPNSVTSIGDRAFQGCSGLTSVTIPNSVTSIGNSTFYGVLNINYTGSASGSPWRAKFANKIVDGDFVYDDTEKTQLVGYFGSSTDVAIPESVTSIGMDAFQGCSGLTSVTIPISVTSIGMDAFYGCSGLTSVTIPNSVTSIGGWAFYGCSGLTSVTIPNSVTSIGGWAFYGCRGLISITIPNSVTSIGEQAFSRVLNINYTGSASGSPWGAKFANKIVDGDFVYNDTEKTQLAGYIGTNIKVTIPENVVSIDSRSFRYCDSLTSVSIPKSVTEIAEKAFYGCLKLDTVTISKRQLKTINKDAFIVIDGTCGDDARWKYDALTKTITIDGTGFLKHYGYDFDTQTDIKTPWADFADKIESVVVEEGINGLGSCAFNNCANIKSISLSATCTDYGGSAFDNCPKLQKVAVKGKYVMRVNDHCFSNYENCTLYVPVDKVDYYKNEIVFKDFSKIIGAYMVTIDNVANGTVSVDSTAILPGGSFTITPIPNNGYAIGSVLVNDTPVEKNDTAYLVENVNENLTVSVSFLLIKSGKCGENVTWRYDSETQTLTISGTGDMYDYQESKTPWYVLKDKTKISNIVIENGVTGIGNNAFNNVKASTIDLAETVNKLGSNCITYNYATVYIHGTKIENIDGAFSDSFKRDGAIKVPIANSEQIADSKVFKGLNVKCFCTITIADGIENGSISAVEVCTAGEKITVTVEPNTGFEIESVNANTKPIEPSNKRYSLVVDSNIVLSATFKAIDYQISTDSYYGIIKVSKIAHYGDTVSFAVEPDEGYIVSYTNVEDEKYNNVDMINDSMFVMPAKDVTIYAYFEEDDHTPVTESAANAITIYAHGNTIVVENATEEIFVYNAMGALVGSDAIQRVRAEIRVNGAGIYIVKVGTVAKRVVIQ